MAFDFPASPSVGQKFPVTPSPGLPTYTWDGEKWSTISGAVSGGNAVCYDLAQSLSPAQQQQARQNIYAAPFDAMAYSGLQINGGMEVSQELGTAGMSVNGSYACDGWRLYWGGTMVQSGAAALTSIVPGFPNTLLVATTTAQASLAAGDYNLVAQYIEGLRVSRLWWGTTNALPVTICFWTAHHRVGIYSITVRNNNNTRSYVATYTQVASDTAQYNVITVPGDTTGTWTRDTSVGISLMFCLGAGSNFIAPSVNTWLAGSYLAASGQVNAAAATTDIFRLTGLFITPGSEAPNAARSALVRRPFDQELITCKRYFQRIGGVVPADLVLQGYTAGANNIAIVIPLVPSMRTSPIVKTAGTAWSLTNVNTQTFFPGTDAIGWQVLASAAGVVSSYANSGSWLSVDARL
jgi:hypothetical protein